MPASAAIPRSTHFFLCRHKIMPRRGRRLCGKLASKTGGRVFLVDEKEAVTWTDLKTIESEMRNQYRLVYNAANFKHDGAFHEIELQPPDRVGRLEVRSGYFAEQVKKEKRQVLRLRLPHGHCMSTGPQAAPLRMTRSWQRMD